MSKKFSIYEGRFFCHSCKNEVLTARYWKQEVELSWKCKECEEVSTLLALMVVDINGLQ